MPTAKKKLYTRPSSSDEDSSDSDADSDVETTRSKDTKVPNTSSS